MRLLFKKIYRIEQKFLILLLLSLIILPSGVFSQGLGVSKQTQQEDLQLLSEKPVQQMPLGNLSGLSYCQNKWWTISDKDDRHLYQLKELGNSFEALPVSLPPISNDLVANKIGWKKLIMAKISSSLDFEGLACDRFQRLYVVSEANSHVLQIAPDWAKAKWLKLPSNLIQEAHRANLLKHFNAGLEGIAVNENGDQLWLIAERDNRGILFAKKLSQHWTCPASCVLLSEKNWIFSPEILGHKQVGVDFSAAVYFKNKLFTLERNAHQICRREAMTGKQERCWSFEKSVLGKPGSRYGDYPFGQAEALWLNNENAWVGLDNNQLARDRDGEKRPLIYQFSAPRRGWLQ